MTPSEAGVERIAIVIPARNAAATLPEAVTTALSQSADEVIIAVGPSSDATRECAFDLSELHPSVKVVDNPSGRTADALNTAIEATSASILVRLDAQARLPEGYVTRAVATLRSTGAGNVGGRQVPDADDGFARAVAAAMRSPFGTGGAAYRAGGGAGPVDTVYLGVFRREALDAVGGFDPRFVRNQDAELNERLRRAGYLVWFDPELAVHYRPRGTIRGLARQYFEYGRYRRLTARVHPGSLRLRQLLPPVTVVVLGGSVAAAVLLPGRGPVLLIPGAYATAVLVAALQAADGLRQVPATACALFVMHVAWGAGFLAGPPNRTS